MDFINIKLSELKEKFKNKEVSSEEIVKFYLDRIKKFDTELGCFITINENAINEARQIDDLRAKGEEIPEYAGIPIALKDNMVTSDIKTTCASKILGNFISPYEATVVKLLKEKGFIILGKLNMDEFAMGSSCENSFFHKTKNPWNKDYVPGGSSGGSAAAVAASLAPFTLGSDTGGSIRQPASFCGVTGLKPTYGRVSRYGLVAFASSLDQIGPVTSSVEDAAELLSIIGIYDNNDSTSAKVESHDYVRYLNGDIKNIKIGIPKEYFGEGLDKEVKQAVEEAIDLYESIGAEIVEITLPHLEYSIATYYILATAEASSNLSRFDGVRYGFRAEANSLNEMYVKTRSQGFGNEVKRRIMMGTYVLSSGYYDAYYLKAQKVRTLIKNDFIEAFKNVDVILSPTSPTTAFKIGEKSDNPLEMYLSDIYTISLNLYGGCGISIPCGFNKNNNMPIGLQLMGNYFDEKTLLNAAYAFQKNTDWHLKKPKL
jgi:aspartyl-tRNA(Asn)/glutamyl-tRNA(Gln) amidotransferase subunit A